MVNFDPSHLQMISEKILENEDIFSCENSCSFSKECIYRTIINRSYYAAFSHFKLWAIDKKKYAENNELAHYKSKSKNSRIGRHKVLTLFIIHNTHKRDEAYIRILANDLNTLREIRNDADYKFDKNISKENAEFVSTISQKIIKNL
ncbi:hypothetical protein [Methanobrevibacter filiformis]|uniref:HEPN domain-containing protein n=1 Tax=Methanobrevibacter filiformis TaxID=55758 RepID=A0A166AQJ5_9EURY|nr:hypothetical protein [Methanobrevibacter filiformis]KZX12348.1 hypothetical protein MBFIL_11530 [Methanobrevibacter filiformis]